MHRNACGGVGLANGNVPPKAVGKTGNAKASHTTRRAPSGPQPNTQRDGRGFWAGIQRTNETLPEGSGSPHHIHAAEGWT